MPETTNKTARGVQISKIAKEVNRQSNEILDYLKRIGVEVSGVMSKVDDTVYQKILGHFKTDLQDAEKHKQKLLEFKKTYKGVEISEIEEDIKKEKEKKLKEDEEKKKKLEEEERLKAEREIQLKKELEETMQQLEKFLQLENKIQQTLTETEEKSNQIIEDAKLKAGEILNLAEEKSTELLQKSREEADRLKSAVINLREEKEILLTKLKTVINYQAHLLEMKVEEAGEEIKESRRPESSSVVEVDVNDIVQKLL